MARSVPAGLSRVWLEHSVRTGVTASLSYAAARLARLPEAYWAPLITLVITQSTLGAAWKVSRQRWIGTALGAVTGALLAGRVHVGILLFGLAIAGLGLICATLRLDRSAYRFAGVTLAIVALVSRGRPPYEIAWHRFCEVSIGLLVALAMAALWPDREPAARASP